MKYDYPMVPDVRYALTQIYSQQDSINLALREIDEWLIASPNDQKAKDFKDILTNSLNNWNIYQ